MPPRGRDLAHVAHLEPGQRLQLQLLVDDEDLGVITHDEPSDRRSAEGAAIHLGGDHASHLLVPVIPVTREQDTMRSPKGA